MPIYEYHASKISKGCPGCRRPFEAFQGIHEKPIIKCPQCGRAVKRVISWCRAAVVETSENTARVEGKVKEYEKAGMWSHAAELADKHSEKSKDKDLKMRPLDNYRKAGYDADSLVKHAKFDND
jgi:putative FmdB family regulatory protein